MTYFLYKDSQSQYSGSITVEGVKKTISSSTTLINIPITVQNSLQLKYSYNFQSFPLNSLTLNGQKLNSDYCMPSNTNLNCYEVINETMSILNETSEGSLCPKDAYYMSFSYNYEHASDYEVAVGLKPLQFNVSGSINFNC